MKSRFRLSASQLRRRSCSIRGGVRVGSGSAYSVVTWLHAGGKWMSGSIPGRKMGLYYFPKLPDRLWDLNKPPFHQALGSLSRGSKWPESVADQSRPSSLYTGCNRRNVRDFGRVFLMLNYTDITQNTYIQSWTVTEIMAIEMCWLLGCRRTVRRPWRHTCPMRTPAQDMVMQSAYVSSDVTR